MVGVTELLIPAALVVIWVVVLEIVPGLVRVFVDIVRDIL